MNNQPVTPFEEFWRKEIERTGFDPDEMDEKTQEREEEFRRLSTAQLERIMEIRRKGSSLTKRLFTILDSFVAAKVLCGREK